MGYCQTNSEGSPVSLVAVLFSTTGHRPLYMSEVVTQDIMDRWIPRTTQIVLIELIAVVAFFQCVRHSLIGKTCVIFVDSEAVEGMLVNGYSSRSASS